MKKTFLATVMFLLMGASSIFAQEFAQTKEIKFARGKSSATVTGTLNGDESMDYSLGARAGQRMKIEFTCTSTKMGYSISSDSGDLANEKRGTTTVTLTDTGTQLISIHGLGVMGVSQVRNARYTMKVTIL